MTLRLMTLRLHPEMSGAGAPRHSRIFHEIGARRLCLEKDLGSKESLWRTQRSKIMGVA
jgi:hypothetical protein